jgi:hypothetical protein
MDLLPTMDAKIRDIATNSRIMLLEELLRIQKVRDRESFLVGKRCWPI